MLVLLVPLLLRGATTACRCGCGGALLLLCNKGTHTWGPPLKCLAPPLALSPRQTQAPAFSCTCNVCKNEITGGEGWRCGTCAGEAAHRGTGWCVCVWCVCVWGGVGGGGWGQRSWLGQLRSCWL